MGKQEGFDMAAAKKKKVEKSTVSDGALKLLVDHGWKDRLLEEIKNQRTNARQVSLKAGRDGSTIVQLLRGDRVPRLDLAMAVCSVLGVSVEWLANGRGPKYVTGSPEPSRRDEYARVPILPLSSILEFIENGETEDLEIMGYDYAEPIDPPGRRFRAEMPDTSMSGIAEKGNILDCSAEMIAEPEDVVVVWLKSQGRMLVRQIIPDTFDGRGNISTGTLTARGGQWTPQRFSSKAGDRIVAVVFDVIKPLRRVRKLRTAPA